MLSLKVAPSKTRVIKIVKNGKGGKDCVIPLMLPIAERLHNFILGKKSDEKVFALKAACISNKIGQFVKKVGLDYFYTYTMRHKFAIDRLER